MYALVEEAPCYHANLRAHQRLFDVLLEQVRRRRVVVRRKEVALGRQYQALYERWRTHLTGDPLPSLQFLRTKCRALLAADIQTML